MSGARCGWADGHPLLRAYHDREWGVPLHDDRAWFEMLVLESFQAGLSWLTILRKREAFRRAFAGFEPALVAAFAADDEKRLLADAGIVRNRAKVRAAIDNARAFIGVQARYGSFDAFAWGLVGGAPLVRRPASEADVPASTAESAAVSRELKRLGFRFIGPTTAYAFMQATGLVMDHTASCFRSAELVP